MAPDEDPDPQRSGSAELRDKPKPDSISWMSSETSGQNLLYASSTLKKKRWDRVKEELFVWFCLFTYLFFSLLTNNIFSSKKQ